jgi:metal-responsive CopG/Arc/MetJ family transcriptional regulator
VDKLTDTLPVPTTRKAIHICLPPALVAEVDKLRKSRRWDIPEIFSYRSRFIEAAVRYFLAALPDLLKDTE